MDVSISRRTFHRMGAAGLLAGSHGPASWAIEPTDVGWTSNDPHLSGNSLPVLRETSGRIPADLRDADLRNGPDPLFKQIAYAYPMDGDGMVRAVYLEGGKARYRNRFVRTASLVVERSAGHAVRGSFAHRCVSLRLCSPRTRSTRSGGVQDRSPFFCQRSPDEFGRHGGNVGRQVR